MCWSEKKLYFIFYHHFLLKQPTIWGDWLSQSVKASLIVVRIHFKNEKCTHFELAPSFPLLVKDFFAIHARVKGVALHSALVFGAL